MKAVILTTLIVFLGGGLLYAASLEQTTCPVMEGTPIDKSISTVYESKTVYFCCKVCRQTFIDSPKKYLSKLPQFSRTDAGTMTDADHSSHSHEEPSRMFSLHNLVKPLGIATYSFLFTTLLVGLFRKKLKRRFLVVHKSLAFITLGLATAHALLILILH